LGELLIKTPIEEEKSIAISCSGWMKSSELLFSSFPLPTYVQVQRSKDPLKVLRGKRNGRAEFIKPIKLFMDLTPYLYPELKTYQTYILIKNVSVQD
jgi:hypothetical protein